jgi:hypothetical protein
MPLPPYVKGIFRDTTGVNGYLLALRVHAIILRGRRGDFENLNIVLMLEFRIGKHCTTPL